MKTTGFVMRHYICEQLRKMNGGHLLEWGHLLMKTHSKGGPYFKEGAKSNH